MQSLLGFTFFISRRSGRMDIQDKISDDFLYRISGSPLRVFFDALVKDA